MTVLLHPLAQAYWDAHQQEAYKWDWQPTKGQQHAVTIQVANPSGTHAVTYTRSPVARPGTYYVYYDGYHMGGYTTKPYQDSAPEGYTVWCQDKGKNAWSDVVLDKGWYVYHYGDDHGPYDTEDLALAAAVEMALKEKDD